MDAISRDKLVKENKKLQFKNVMLEAELKKREEENKKLKELNEYDYIEDVRKGYEQVISALTKEKKELNNVMLGLKKEIEYHNERVKYYKNKAN